MSEIKLSGTTVINNTGGAVTVDANQLQIGSTTVIDNNKKLSNLDIVPNSSFMFRNKIINGGMKIAQRGTTGTTPNTVNYLLDRFSLIRLGGYPDNSTQTQESDSPTGHSKSLKMIRNSSHTLTGTHASALTYIVEGNDIYHLDWGSSTAKAVTISFWVKSNQIGNFPLILADSNTAFDIGKLYTISNANTWEHKTIFIEGPTSGTFNTDNTAGFHIYWGFGAIDSSRTAQGSTWGVSNSSGTSKTMVSGASTALATDSGASFQITGVQLEEGTVATPFEHRPIGIELSLCERYYQVKNLFGTNTIHYAHGYFGGSANYNYYTLNTTMRSAPAVTISQPTQVQIYHNNGSWTNVTIAVQKTYTDLIGLYFGDNGNNYSGLIRLTGDAADTKPTALCSSEFT